MSNTRRYTQEGWIHPDCNSLKHQQKDRKGKIKWKFNKHTKNCLYNLKEKVYDMICKEKIQEIEND